MATHSDVLMVLVKGGSAIPGESQATFSPKDPLLSGPPKFEEKKCFELDEFSMNLACPHDDSADPKTQVQQTIGVNNKGRMTTAVQRRTSTGAKFLPPNLNEVSLTRKMDSASPQLFDECAKKTKFDSAAIIRRKVTGGGIHHGHETGHLMTYLRIDFTKVQITSVNWNSDDEDIKETITFFCEAASVQYRQQLHSGSVTDRPLPPGKWTKAG